MGRCTGTVSKQHVSIPRAFAAALFATLTVAFAFPPTSLHASGRPEARDPKLEIFSWWTAGGEAEGLAAMFEIYRTKYPTVQIINATVAGGAGSNAKAVLDTRMRGGNPPDSFQVHAGHELIDSWVLEGKMEPITFVFRDNGWLNAFPRDLIDIISWRGEIYSVPVNIHRSNVLWYNKKIFTDNGLVPPTTFDQLVKFCDMLAGKGITPLALGDNGIWASVHLLESVLLATMGPARYKGLWTGSTPWDGGELRTALSRFATLLHYANTYHATLSWDAAAQYVIDGKCAMTVMGDWVEGYFKARGFTPNKEFGWVPFPGTKGTFMMLSDSFGLPRGAPDRDAAVKWLTMCASREGQDAFNPKKGSIPSRTDCNRALYDVYLQSAMDSFRSDTIVPSLTHGAAAAEGWVNQVQDVISLFACDLDVEKATAGLVAAARKYVR